MSTQNPQSLRIFTIILQIEQLLESAPKPKLGAGGRRLIDVEEIFDLLGDLKVTIPEDIRRANSVLLEADQLIASANQEALDTVERAQQEADALHEQALNELAQSRQAAEQEFQTRVAEDAVHLEVQRRSEILQQHAEYNAQLVFNNAKEYADAILQDLQRYLMEYHQQVGKNRDELIVSASVRRPEAAQPQAAAYAPQPVAAQAAYEEEVEEEENPRRWRGGLFRKNESDFLSQEEAEQSDATPIMPQRRGRRPGRPEGLDLDLEE